MISLMVIVNYCVAHYYCLTNETIHAEYVLCWCYPANRPCYAGTILRE